MNYQELEKKVLEWADDKEILDKATPLTQARKTEEEVQELIEACVAQQNEKETFINSKGKLVNTQEELKDAFGDILVTIIIGAVLQGLNLEDCLESAYNVIKNRKGSIIDGTFVKND